MKTTIMAFAIATFISIAGCKSATLQAGSSGNLSSSYSFKQGHGNLPASHYWNDHMNYVARDWNGDGRKDVLSLPSVHAVVHPNGATHLFQPHAFISNGDGSFRVQMVGGQAINNTAGEWDGNYFAGGTIVVGNGPGSSVNSALIFHGLHGQSGPRFLWHNQAVADVNKDGQQDLIAFGAGTAIYLGFNPGGIGFHNGNGETVHLGSRIIENTGAFAGTFRDLDGDGYPEMITGAYAHATPHQQAGGAVTGGGITVWKNHGGKSFSVMQQLSGTGGGNRTMHQNGSDIIAYSECGDDCAANSMISVYSTGGGRLHLKQRFNLNGGVTSSNKGHSPLLVDVNGDGHKDLITHHKYNHSGNLSNDHRAIWLNNGNGTFSQLGTPIFAGIHKAGMGGSLIPIHANGDNRMDWIVLYADGSFGTLIAPGDSTYNSGGTGGGDTGGGGYADYVRGNGDLLAAYNANSMGKSIEAWGQWHWNAYGKNEPHRKNKPNPGSKIKVKDIVNNHEAESRGRDGGDRFWQLNFIKDQLFDMNSKIINSNNVGFSFNNAQMLDVYKHENMTFKFGMVPADEYGNVEDFVLGMSFGDTDIAVATDNTLLGWSPGQSLLNISNMESRYINIRRSKTVNDWTLSGNMTYALAQGGAGYGYVKGMDDFHAMGFGINADYNIDEDNVVKFGVSQPLRIERGALHFDNVIADMTPDGREIDYTMSYTNKVSKTSIINLQLSYASDVDHFKGENNAKIMAIYKGTW